MVIYLFNERIGGKSEKVGFAPEGYNSLELVISHQLGHLLDFRFDFLHNPILVNYFNKLTD